MGQQWKNTYPRRAGVFHVCHDPDRQQLTDVGHRGRNQRWWRARGFVLSAFHSRLARKESRYSCCLRISRADWEIQCPIQQQRWLWLLDARLLLGTDLLPNRE